MQLLDHQANVILPVYAFLFLLAGVLVRARDTVLLTLAGAGVIAGPMLWLVCSWAAGTRSPVVLPSWVTHPRRCSPASWSPAPTRSSPGSGRSRWGCGW